MTTAPSSSPYAAARDGSGSQTGEMQSFLQKTSRTFALTIPLLPEPLRTEISLSYLLFRIIDTFEDATNWVPQKRIAALKGFVQMLRRPHDQSIQTVAADWLRQPPLAHPGYLELLGATPQVLRWFGNLDQAACVHVREHLERSALGMCDFVERSDGRGALRLQTMADLRGYCFVVAGIVGQMLTELFVLRGGQRLADVASGLRDRSVAFGEGLQLTNILKDAAGDAAEGRVYLPKDVLMAEVFTLARADLAAAAEYVELLRTGGAPRGLVAFNALNARLAVATLRLLRDRGPGAKLTRQQVLGVAAEVTHALEIGAPLFEGAAREHHPSK
ncbi:MAG: squalene/phytoene synthase family protein [Myxococcales bacterium]